MAEPKHTPPPWHFGSLRERGHGARQPIFDEGLWAIYDDPGERVNPVPVAVVDHADDHCPDSRRRAHADAAFIVRAVNSYESREALVGELREVLSAVVRDCDETYDVDDERVYGGTANASWEVSQETIDRARALLQKLEEAGRE